MSKQINTTDLETAAVTFFGAFLTELAVFGGTLLQSVELAGIAAAGVLGYHYISGNVAASGP